MQDSGAPDSGAPDSGAQDSGAQDSGAPDSRAQDSRAPRVAGLGAARAADRLGILHVDMDAFFVAVEALADPNLLGRPVIVGGMGGRGVVASCSYEARAYGVHSAMPSARARRACPQAVWVAGNYDAYAEVSKALHELLGSFSPLVEGIALDEAFVDVSGARRLLGPAPAIAAEMRVAVRDRLHLDCSVGVASCKLLAKLASKAAKPLASLSGTKPGPGVVVIRPDEELSFLHPLPVRALWGVGPATAARLARIGVERVGQLAQVPVGSLVTLLGPALGRQLHDLAWARDPRAVQPNRELKSVGHEETYAVDHTEAEFLHRQVVRMADAVATRLAVGGRSARTVTLKVRFGDFSTITRSRSYQTAFSDGPRVARSALELLAGVDTTPGVRLLGVSVSGLSQRAETGVGAGGFGTGGRQLSLELAGGGAPIVTGVPAGVGASAQAPAPASAPEAALTAASAEAAVAIGAAVGAVRDRFGAGSVGPAALAGRGRGLDVKRVGDAQWGPSRRTDS